MHAQTLMHTVFRTDTERTDTHTHTRTIICNSTAPYPDTWPLSHAYDLTQNAHSSTRVFSRHTRTCICAHTHATQNPHHIHAFAFSHHHTPTCLLMRLTHSPCSNCGAPPGRQALWRRSEESMRRSSSRYPPSHSQRACSLLQTAREHTLWFEGGECFGLIAVTMGAIILLQVFGLLVPLSWETRTTLTPTIGRALILAVCLCVCSFCPVPRASCVGFFCSYRLHPDRFTNLCDT